MNPHENKVMALPPHPPAAVNTVISAIVGLVLSLSSIVVSLSAHFFPSNAPVETFFAALSAFIIFIAGFIVGLRALMNETKRVQFKHVVLEYTRITGDKRYLPYILPTHGSLILILFVINVALPVLNFASGTIGVSNV